MAKELKQIEGNVPIELIEASLNDGLLEIKSEQLMKYFEKIAGHRIYTPKPIENLFKKQEEALLQQRKAKQIAAQKSAQSSNQKVVGTAQKLPDFMDKNLSLAEMYKLATDKATQIRDSNEVLQKNNYGLNLATRYKEWMTPELFDYLSMKGARAEAEFRAACYPARVAFSHRIQRVEGRLWATPYITIFSPPSASDSKDDYNLKMGGTAYSFYLTKDREIHAINDEIQRVDTIKSPETRDKQKAESLQAWRKSNCNKRVRVVNPKTGVEQFALLHTLGTEGWQEK